LILLREKKKEKKLINKNENEQAPFFHQKSDL
jgi:hypothetical protein